MEILPVNSPMVTGENPKNSILVFSGFAGVPDEFRDGNVGALGSVFENFR